MDIVQAEVGVIGLITENPDGTIVQIGLTQSQSSALQLFLAAMSKESPLLRLGSEYDLVLKNR